MRPTSIFVNILLAMILATSAACGSSGSSSSSGSGSSSSSSSGGSGSSSSGSNGGGSSGNGHIVAELDFEHLYELADFPIGMAVSAGNEGRSIFRGGAQAERSAAERAVIEQHFDQLTAGNIMKMSYLHNNWQTFTYTQADQLVNYASDNNMTVHGHALVWHACYQVPSWVGQTSPGELHNGDSAIFLDMLAEHVEAIAAKYAGTIPSWDVVNEAFQDPPQGGGKSQYRQGTTHCWDNGESSVFYQYAGGPEYIETAFIAARAGDPSADLYYNDFNLSPNDGKLEAVLEMVDDFQARDIPIDGIGFQMHIHMGWPSIDAIRSSFESVVQRGLKVKITELDIPINNPWAGSPTYTSFTQAAANDQRRRYCEVVSAYMDVVDEHLRGGVSVWGLVDGDSWLIDHFFGGEQAYPLLFNDDLTPKPALMGLADGLRGHSCN